MFEPDHFNGRYFISHIFRNVSWFTLKNFFTPQPLMRGLYLLTAVHFFQVLGTKPELRVGDDDDDSIADISNRKMAKLYMVSTLL